jgi:hypothetical protein
MHYRALLSAFRRAEPLLGTTGHLSQRGGLPGDAGHLSLPLPECHGKPFATQTTTGMPLGAVLGSATYSGQKAPFVQCIALGFSTDFATVNRTAGARRVRARASPVPLVKQQPLDHQTSNESSRRHPSTPASTWTLPAHDKEPLRTLSLPRRAATRKHQWPTPEPRGGSHPKGPTQRPRVGRSNLERQRQRVMIENTCVPTVLGADLLLSQ